MHCYKSGFIGLFLLMFHKNMKYVKKFSSSIFFQNDLKGQCHEIFYSGFFIKQLLPVPLDTPRKDLEFFRIYEELFVFVIKSSVYSPPGRRDSRCLHHRGVVTLRCIHHRGVESPQCIHCRGVDLDWFTKEPC
jgi:hypothetical protein